MSESKDNALIVTSAILSAVPYLGGPLSAILSGKLTQRKMDRIRECLDRLAEDLDGFKSDSTERYVETDEFEELLEKTLHAVSDERHETKRRMYGAFLLETLKTPFQPYDDRVEFIRVMERLQGDHIRMLQAIRQDPDPNAVSKALMGSIGQTLQRRMQNVSDEKMREVYQALKDLRLISLGDLNAMMTPSGAENLKTGLTPFGSRFVKYLCSDD